MQVVLWDTARREISKDSAAGLGQRRWPHGGSRMAGAVRRFVFRDRPPAALLLANLAGVFESMGHEVLYCEDVLPGGADLYVFCPSLPTLRREREAIAQTRAENPAAPILVVGSVASLLPDALADLGATIVQGDAEQLLWRLDDVLAQPGAVVQLGTLDDLDLLPFPDWQPFAPRRFRLGSEFWAFPTVSIASSRGCPMKYGCCPHQALDGGARFRDPHAVAEEMEYVQQRWGAASFRFLDPLFGLNRTAVFRLAELLGRMPRKFQFSVESRAELLRPEVLRVLKRVGLTCVHLAIETPDRATLHNLRRVAAVAEQYRDFIALCRGKGIRTVAGFMIGLPADTEQTIADVSGFARLLNPTIAQFHVATPYPGTKFWEEPGGQIADADFGQCDSYTPTLRYQHLTADAVGRLRALCSRQFFGRWDYWANNAHLLWPRLQRLGIGREQPSAAGPGSCLPEPVAGHIVGNVAPPETEGQRAALKRAG